MRMVVETRKGAPGEPRQHEVLRPPSVLSRDRGSAQTARDRAVTIDGDVERQDARLDRHRRSLLCAVRAVAYGAGQMERLRTLSEAECYERCYGWRWSDDSVKVLRPSGPGREPDPRDDPSELGERLRHMLELKLDAREPEAA
jgi:hypothetical protein